MDDTTIVRLVKESIDENEERERNIIRIIQLFSFVSDTSLANEVAYYEKMIIRGGIDLPPQPTVSLSLNDMPVEIKLAIMNQNPQTMALLSQVNRNFNQISRNIETLLNVGLDIGQMTDFFFLPFLNGLALVVNSDDWRGYADEDEYVTAPVYVYNVGLEGKKTGDFFIRGGKISGTIEVYDNNDSYSTLYEIDGSGPLIGDGKRSGKWIFSIKKYYYDTRGDEENREEEIGFDLTVEGSKYEFKEHKFTNGNMSGRIYTFDTAAKTYTLSLMRHNALTEQFTRPYEIRDDGSNPILINI